MTNPNTAEEHIKHYDLPEKMPFLENGKVEFNLNLKEFLESYTQSQLQELRQQVEELHYQSRMKADQYFMTEDEAKEEAYFKVINLIDQLQED